MSVVKAKHTIVIDSETVKAGEVFECPEKFRKELEAADAIEDVKDLKATEVRTLKPAAAAPSTPLLASVDPVIPPKPAPAGDGL